MSVEWHPKRWRNFCMGENEKKEVEPILVMPFVRVSNIQNGSIETFSHRKLYTKT